MFGFAEISAIIAKAGTKMTETPMTREALAAVRAARRRLSDGNRVRNDAEAVRYIEERGFALLMPVAYTPLPSLSEADAAAPWEGFAITDRAWAWKETLPALKLCSYGKFFYNRGTFISWRFYPAFLAAYGPAGDLREEYEAGRLGRLELTVAETVAAGGPISSHDLWRKMKPVFNGKRTRFTAALDHLQMLFILTVAGGSLEGWTQHDWDLVERQVPPHVLENLPKPADARAALLLQTLENCVVATERQLRSLLRWTQADMERRVQALTAEGKISRIRIDGEEHFVLA